MAALTAPAMACTPQDIGAADILMDMARPNARGTDATVERLDTTNLEFTPFRANSTSFSYIPVRPSVSHEMAANRYDESGCSADRLALFELPKQDYLSTLPTDKGVQKLTKEMLEGRAKHCVGLPMMVSASEKPRLTEVKTGFHNPETSAPWRPLPLFDSRLTIAHREHADAFYARQSEEREQLHSVIVDADDEVDDDGYGLWQRKSHDGIRNRRKSSTLEWKSGCPRAGMVDRMIAKVPGMRRHLETHKQRSDVWMAHRSSAQLMALTSVSPDRTSTYGHGMLPVEDMLSAGVRKVMRKDAANAESYIPAAPTLDNEDWIAEPDCPIGIYNCAEGVHYLERVREEVAKAKTQSGKGTVISKKAAMTVRVAGEVEVSLGLSERQPLSAGDAKWARDELIARKRILPPSPPKAPRGTKRKAKVELEAAVGESPSKEVNGDANTALGVAAASRAVLATSSSEGDSTDSSISSPQGSTRPTTAPTSPQPSCERPRRSSKKPARYATA